MRFPYHGVLFLCRGNSVRSQMAEGLFRAVAPSGVETWSAGVTPIGVDRRSAEVMSEIGIDISDHWSKTVNEIPLDHVDLVITLCGFDADPCPLVRGDAERRSWPMPDPYMATPMGGDGLDGFRAVRDELRKKIDELVAERKK